MYVALMVSCLVISAGCQTAAHHSGESITLDLARGSAEGTAVTVAVGQNLADILEVLGEPDYCDDDPWFAYKAAPKGSYVLLFAEQARADDSDVIPELVTVWGVAGPGDDPEQAVFLLPNSLRGQPCGDFLALRVRLDSGLKKVVTVAVGMTSNDVLRLFHPVGNLTAEDGYILFPSIDDGHFLLVFTARNDSGNDDSASDRLSEVIYQPGGQEQPIYLLPFNKRGQDVFTKHRALLDR